MKPVDQVLAIIVAFVWGTNFVLIEIGLEDFPPFLLACLRFALVAFPLAFIVRRPKVGWGALASYGFLIGFGQFGLMFWAIQDNITPGLASLVVQIQVFFTILLATLFLGEKVRRIQWFALLISFAGLVVIALFTDGQTTAIGLLAMLAAALGWAGGNIIVKLEEPSDILSFIIWSSIFAVPPLLAMSVVFEGWPAIKTSIFEASGVGWGVVFWQALGNMLMGYGIWNLLLGRYSAALVTPWALLVPVFGITTSAYVLNEPLQSWKLIATALIVSGLVLNLKASQKPSVG